MWYSAWVLDGMAVVGGLIGSSKAEGFHTGVFFGFRSQRIITLGSP
jgi:hypothetical protein